MLPDLREYIIDRTNLSAIGDFTVHAVKASKNIKCHGTSIDFVDDSLSDWLDPWADKTFSVRTHPSNTVAAAWISKNVTLRYQPRALTAWVDNLNLMGDTRATTKLIFAIVNGTIDTGHVNNLPDFLGGSNCIGCNGVSALACEVDVSLEEGLACNGECKPELAKTLTSHSSLDTITFIPVWLGAIPTLMGPFTLGAQPVLVPGLVGMTLANSSFALPVAYTNIGEAAIASYEHNWTEANITNFINVTSGALATYIGQAHADGWTLLQSSSETLRLNSSRAYILLIPLMYILVCLVVLATVSLSMHQSGGMSYLQRGRVRELLIAGSTDELRKAVDHFRSKPEPKDTPLDQLQLRYGFDRSGHGLLGTRAVLRPSVQEDDSSTTHRL